MGGVEKPPIRLSEGVVIAAAPAYGYLLAYVYRRGFAHELTIPLEFIQVELSDVLFMTVSALAAGTVLLLVAHVVLSLAEALPQDRRWRLAYLLAVVWLATNVPPLVIFRHHLERVWFLVVSSTAVTLSALWAAWSSPPPKIGIGRLETIVGRALLLGFPILFLVALNAHELGTAQALDQREYLVVPSTGEAVLAIYGRTAVVAAHFDGQLQDRFRLVDVTGLDLERRRIGPLKPPKKVPAPSSEPVDPARQAP